MTAAGIAARRAGTEGTETRRSSTALEGRYAMAVAAVAAAAAISVACATTRGTLETLDGAGAMKPGEAATGDMVILLSVETATETVPGTDPATATVTESTAARTSTKPGVAQEMAVEEQVGTVRLAETRGEAIPEDATGGSVMSRVEHLLAAAAGAVVVETGAVTTPTEDTSVTVVPTTNSKPTPGVMQTVDRPAEMAMIEDATTQVRGAVPAGMARSTTVATRAGAESSAATLPGSVMAVAAVTVVAAAVAEVGTATIQETAPAEVGTVTIQETVPEIGDEMWEAGDHRAEAAETVMTGGASLRGEGDTRKVEPILAAAWGTTTAAGGAERAAREEREPPSPANETIGTPRVTAEDLPDMVEIIIV